MKFPLASETQLGCPGEVMPPQDQRSSTEEDAPEDWGEETAVALPYFCGETVDEIKAAHAMILGSAHPGYIPPRRSGRK